MAASKKELENKIRDLEYQIKSLTAGLKLQQEINDIKERYRKENEVLKNVIVRMSIVMYGKEE